MNRKSLIASVLGASFIFATMFSSPASAYPPGTNMNLSVSNQVVDWDDSSSPIQFTLTNTGTSKVYVWVNGKKRFSTSSLDSSGSVSWSYTPATYGRHIITGTVGTEKKTIYVYRPTRPIIYSTQITSKPFLVKTKGAKPGTPYTVEVNGSIARIKVSQINSGGFGTVYVPANLLRKGNNTVTFMLGNLHYTKIVVGTK